MIQEEFKTLIVNSKEELEKIVKEKMTEGYVYAIPSDSPRELSCGVMLFDPPAAQEDYEPTTVRIFRTLHIKYFLHPNAKVNPTKLLDNPQEIIETLKDKTLFKCDNPIQLRIGFSWHDSDLNEINSIEFHVKHLRKSQELKRLYENISLNS